MTDEEVAAQLRNIRDLKIMRASFAVQLLAALWANPAAKDLGTLADPALVVAAKVKQDIEFAQNAAAKIMQDAGLVEEREE